MTRELKNLEGKLEGAIPLGKPVTCVSYLTNKENPLKSIKVPGGIMYDDGVAKLIINPNDKEEDHLNKILKNHVRNYPIPEGIFYKGANSYCQSEPVILRIPTGLIITSSIQFYKTNKKR